MLIAITDGSSVRIFFHPGSRVQGLKKSRSFRLDYEEAFLVSTQSTF
jgi:hypothetical protein